MHVTNQPREPILLWIVRALFPTPEIPGGEEHPMTDKEFYLGIGLTVLLLVFVSIAFGTFPL